MTPVDPAPAPTKGGGEGVRNPDALASTSVVAVRCGVEDLLDRVGLGHLAHRVWQFVRYGAVSVVATLTSLTVLGALVATATLTPGWANIVATGIGTVPSFELNRRWVWGKTGRRSVAAEIGPFCVLSFAGLAVSTVLVSAAGHWATGAGLDALWRTAVIEAANVAAFGSLWILQFLVLDRVLFARRGRGPRHAGAGRGWSLVRGPTSTGCSTERPTAGLAGVAQPTSWRPSSPRSDDPARRPMERARSAPPSRPASACSPRVRRWVRMRGVSGALRTPAG